MDRHLRGLAPISDAAWQAVEEEARTTLKLVFAARRLVDFEGPLGPGAAAVGTGRSDAVKGAPAKGVAARVRRSQPLVEIRTDFELDRRELEAVDHGARDADLGTVVESARALALAEDKACFHGFDKGCIRGICPASPHDPLSIGKDYVDYPKVIVEALHTLVDAGVSGPYGIALGPRCYSGLMKTIHPSGRPVIDFVKSILDGPVVRANAVDGAVVVSLRGGDFHLVCGEDVALGYRSHDEEKVRLYLEEAFTFRVDAPDAAVWLRYES